MKKKLTVKDYNDLLARTEAAEAKAKQAEEQAKGFLGGHAPQIYTPSRTGMGSMEQKALLMFGASSTGVKGLLGINTCADKFKHVDPELKKMVYQLKTDFITNRVISQMFYDGNWDFVGTNEKQFRAGKTPSFTDTYFFKNVLGPKIKAFTTGANPGQDWIPTATASTFINEIEISRDIVAMLRQVQMPTSPYELPTKGYSVARRASENVSATEGTYENGKLTMTAKKFQEYYIFSEEMQEDSAPDAVAAGQFELEQAHLRAFETACINGVEFGTTHIDSDTEAGGAELAEKQYNGWRYEAIQNAANGAIVDFENAVVSDAKLLELRQRMGKAGNSPQDLVYVPGSISYLQMVATDNVIPIDRAGSMATITQGSLGKYHGSDVVTTGFMRADLNAAGQYDATITDRTGLLLIHKDRWYFGTRRPIRLAIRPSRSADDRIEMASYSRVDFIGHPQGSPDVQGEELTVVYGVNVALQPAP